MDRPRPVELPCCLVYKRDHEIAEWIQRRVEAEALIDAEVCDPFEEAQSSRVRASDRSSQLREAR